MYFRRLGAFRASAFEKPTEGTMTTISKDADLITLINVFAVDPSNQSRLVELLTTVTDRFVRHARGFISSSLHRSRDGTKVTMYAQWRSLDDYETMRRDPGARFLSPGSPHHREVRAWDLRRG
jgi:hypothetical protein